ncbi:MAG: gamma-glutamylcyclotransferase [Rhodobacteraceae bacterium]|nr:gamma-glutamylcyclotransferase [Paracoccaceae bacterium]
MAFWVFGYGSLLWNPGFTPVETTIARLDGFSRSFCMLSIHYRGTHAQPGLVLALDAQDQASCDGLALLVAPDEEAQVLASLRERELISSAYMEKQVSVSCANGAQVTALTYVIDPTHVQYCNPDLEQQAQMIARAHGGRGPNAEYLFNTTDHLAKIGLHDPQLEQLSARVRVLLASEQQ